jgi:mRNA interferase MazF
MRQGEIWFVDLNPVRGSEQAGFRPVVIISGNLMNRYLPVVIVVPLTTKIENYQGNPVIQPDLENGLSAVSEMLVFHIRSISKDRLIKKLGVVPNGVVKNALATLHDITTL